MKPINLAFASAALLTSAALLAGCGGTSSTPAAKPSTGGAAVIALAPQTSPNWFFPMLSAAAFSDVNSQVDSMMYRPLIMFNDKDQVDYARSLVSNITPNANGTEYTLTLSHKYRWSNGDPITANDVVFTWDITKAASEPNAVWVYGGQGIGGIPSEWTSVTADGADKVVVKLSQPTNPDWFIHNGLGQLWPVPEKVWNKYPTNLHQEMTFINHVANSPLNKVYDVVDGPYHIQSYTPNDQWTFVPNPKFGGHKSSLSKVIFQYETSDSTEFAGLEKGTINEGYLPPSDWKARNQLKNDVMSTPYPLGFNYLIVNLNPKAPGGLGPVFSQLYVRQALQMGINQPGIIKTVFNGQAIEEGGPVAALPKTPYSDPATAKPLYPYNPAKGKKLLEAHGWHEVHGVMEKNGVKLEWQMLGISGDIAQTNLQQLLVSGWSQEGIKVGIQPELFDNIISPANQQHPTSWDMADWGGGWTYQPDYYPSGDGLFNTNAASNFQGYSSKTMDQLINTSIAPASSEAQSLKNLYAYELYTAQQLPGVLYLPFPASGYPGNGDLPEHAQNLQGTVSSYNPITDMIFPNYWTIKN
jgi:peptide/nickel transport system substrate-binding protein